MQGSLFNSGFPISHFVIFTLYFSTIKLYETLFYAGIVY